LLKFIPAAIVALFFGIGAYFAMAVLNTDLLTITNNRLIIGPISASGMDAFRTTVSQWSHLELFNAKDFLMIRGDFFGEMSFLDKETRSADAIAVNDVLLYVLSRSQFERINQLHPEIAGIFFERLAHAISLRLRLTNIELMAMEEG
jgi:CRP-like cAMP-binding protein